MLLEPSQTVLWLRLYRPCFCQDVLPMRVDGMPANHATKDEAEKTGWDNR